MARVVGPAAAARSAAETTDPAPERAGVAQPRTQIGIEQVDHQIDPHDPGGDRQYPYGGGRRGRAQNQAGEEEHAEIPQEASRQASSRASRQRLSVKYRSDPRWSHIRFVRLISAHEVEAFAATVEHAK